MWQRLLHRGFLLWLCALLVTACAVPDPEAQVKDNPNPPLAISLNGAGASFPKFLYDRYFPEFKQETGITVNYEGVGSGAGLRQFLGGTVDFAGSDVLLKPEQASQIQRGMVAIPTAGGAIAVIYNLEGVKELKLSRQNLVDIFMGEIQNWNDSRIAENNPDVQLPDAEIKPVVRADASGTTYTFTNHLAALSESFKETVGVSLNPRWKEGFLTARENAGIAQMVLQTPNAIGYVEAVYAIQNKIPTAAIENRAGQYVLPELADTNKAFAEVKFNEDLSADISDPSDGYPIIGVTYLLFYGQYPEPAKAEAVQKLADWIHTKGQEINETLFYTRIPPEIGTKAIAKVKSQVKMQ
ncbi:MAG: phosphate ABC transporter substrate-binding protein PstS [Pseudanabaenaceae cyanobacterium]